jgi:hypothetical protein
MSSFVSQFKEVAQIKSFGKGIYKGVTTLIKISLLSDTHSYMDQQILDLCAESQEIWHAGDIGDFKVCQQLSEVAPLRAVYGNIDDHQLRAEYPLNMMFEVDNLKVLITHIGGYPPRYNSRTRKLIEAYKPDLYICGHSHILKVMRDPQYDLLHMNPGAIGKHGFHQKRTMLRFAIEKARVKDLELVELPR